MSIAEDWPMWGGNSHHTFVSGEELPESMALVWSSEQSTPDSAWPTNQAKLKFDAAPSPVIADGTVFIPSTVTDSLTALDLASGQKRWIYYCNGPVRFAPVYANGKIYFGSDDGIVYCLEAKTGRLLWSFRGGPHDRKLLGNDRFISMWPVRGAPVISEGKLYFAAGIWPFMGIFIYALDAETGKVVWNNSGTGSMYIKQQHGSPAFAGVAPQGYMTIAQDKLLVPGGRTVPAVFSLNDGQFLYYKLDNRQLGRDAGGYDIKAGEKYFFNDREIYFLKDGAGCQAQGAEVIGKNEFFSVVAGEIVAIRQPTDEKAPVVKIIKPKEPNAVWRHTPGIPVKRILLKAGNSLVCLGDNSTLFGFETGKKKVTWSVVLPEDPVEAAWAHGHIVVSGVSGTVYCLGNKGAGDKAPLKIIRTQIANDKDPLAGLLLSLTERKTNAYVLMLRPDSAATINTLLHDSGLSLIILEDDSGLVQQYRDKYYNSPFFGRIHVVHGSVLNTVLPAYFADVVVGGKRFAEMCPKANSEMVLNTIRPYGGFAFLAAECETWAKNSITGNEALLRKGEHILIKRPGGLEGAGNWTHQSADSGNSLFSPDRLVKAPLGLLWFGGPPNDEILPRHGHGPSPQVMNGSLFIEGPDIIRAVDIYTGHMLWQKNIEDVGMYYDNTGHHPGANEIGGNYVCTEDAVYISTPRGCLKLNPKTGEEENNFKLPDKSSWGYTVVKDDCLIVAGSPLGIPSAKDEMKPVIEPNAQWRYCVGIDPDQKWVLPEFDDTDWKTGMSGFGFGDYDDKTKLDIHNKFTRVYIRKEFETNPKDVASMMLTIRYDDAFIAYLNGTEVIRKGVGNGSGKDAQNISIHEAGSLPVSIEVPIAYIRKGRNIFCIEGHNANLESSDFTLDPSLWIVPPKVKATNEVEDADEVNIIPFKGVEQNTAYSSSSKMLYVLDRQAGAVKWKRQSAFNFRHNSIIAADGMVFCIDSLSPQKQTFLKRRGVELKDRPVLYCLDMKTGNVVWREDKKVFGTWLSYSAEYKLLFQGGSANRDRALDEVAQGMAVFKAATGELVWSNDLKYKGPCILRHNQIITDGAAVDLLTGEPVKIQDHLTGKPKLWSFSRNYGCNTAIANENLIAFRSAAAGYFNLVNNSGTGNFGGFKSGCTSNLIPGGGILNAPDYTRTCTCSYQNQTSLAMVYMPEVETWTFPSAVSKDRVTGIRRLGLNFGAPGDHMSSDGTLWLEWPVVGGPSPNISISTQPGNVRSSIRHTSLLAGNDPLKWVAASYISDVKQIKIDVGTKGTYTLRLVFPKPDEPTSFDFSIDEKNNVKGFSPSKAEEPVIVLTFNGIKIDNQLVIDFTANHGTTLISGLELVME